MYILRTLQSPAGVVIGSKSGIYRAIVEVGCKRITTRELFFGRSGFPVSGEC